MPFSCRGHCLFDHNEVNAVHGPGYTKDMQRPGEHCFMRFPEPCDDALNITYAGRPRCPRLRAQVRTPSAVSLGLEDTTKTWSSGARGADKRRRLMGAFFRGRGFASHDGRSGYEAAHQRARRFQNRHTPGAVVGNGRSNGASLQQQPQRHAGSDIAQPCGRCGGTARQPSIQCGRAQSDFRKRRVRTSGGAPRSGRFRARMHRRNAVNMCDLAHKIPRVSASTAGT
jgi:hypothetical protein